MSTNGKSGFDKVKESRKLVDKSLIEVKDIIGKNSIFKSYDKRINSVQENLKYVRTRVDTVSSEYKSILFEVYHHKIFQSLFGAMKIVALMDTSSEMKDYLTTYNKFTALKENTALENTGIFFILSGSKKMSDKDLMLWDSLLVKDTMPEFSTIHNRGIVEKLNALITPEEFSKIGFKERALILYGSTTGEYPV